MKKHFSKLLILALAATACRDGYMDDIKPVAAGPDEEAPEVTISYPASETVLIPFTDESTQLNFELEVQDDIEITSITVALNGTTLTTLDDFKDYRRVVASHQSETLPLGDYTLEVTATDASGKTTTKSQTFEISNVYQAKYDGEIFYMPFEGDVYLDLLGDISASAVGSPGFAAGKSGQAYSGAADAYLTLPMEGLANEEFSASFWYKMDAATTHAGILTVSPPGPTNNNRTSGFRLFREPGGEGMQRIKLNVGNGVADTWVDGATAADVDPASGWVHVAFTIAPDRCALYLNGELVKDAAFTGVSWADCNALSIGSGAPNFTEWGHVSEQGQIDELRIFNKALSLEEVQQMVEDN